MLASAQRSWWPIAIVAVALWLAQPMQAQPAPGGTRYAVVDMIHVFNNAQQVVDINEVFRQRQDAYETEVRKRRAEIDKLEQQGQAFTPTSREFADVQEKLIEQQAELETYMRATEAKLRHELGMWRLRTYNLIVDTVRDIASRGMNLDLVLFKDDIDPSVGGSDMGEQIIRQRKVIYAAPDIDITQRVLDQLNNDYRQKGGKDSLNLKSD
jgi:Skp family chaperone for outer membrane proteins